MERAWWKSSFTREKLIDAAKELAWVGPLTVLIWVYAEREQVITQQANDVLVEVVTSDHNRFVKPSEAGTPHVQIKLQGPQATLDRVRQQLAAGIPRGVEIDIGHALGKGQGQQINIKEWIQNQPLFKENGVSVLDTNPPEIAVDVDEITERELDVEIPPGITNLTSATAFDPRRVRVRGPDGELQHLASNKQLKVWADIRPEAIDQPGQHPLPSVSLVLPVADENISIIPRTVRAVLDVRAADVPYQIEAVPINISMPAPALQAYTVTLTNGNSMPNVNVTGPQQQIDQLKSGKFLAKAILEVSSDDYNHEEPRRLQYQLPDGVKVSPADAAKTVEFKLVKRDTSAG